MEALLDAPSPALEVSLIMVNGQKEEPRPTGLGEMVSSRKQSPTGERGR